MLKSQEKVFLEGFGYHGNIQLNFNLKLFRQVTDLYIAEYKIDLNSFMDRSFSLRLTTSTLTKNNCGNK